MVKGPFTTMSKFITGAFKLGVVIIQVLDSEGNSKPRGRVFIRYLASTEGKGKNLAGWSAVWRKPKGSSRG